MTRAMKFVESELQPVIGILASVAERTQDGTEGDLMKQLLRILFSLVLTVSISASSFGGSMGLMGATAVAALVIILWCIFLFLAGCAALWRLG
jgi:hypothetical protein